MLVPFSWNIKSPSDPVSSWILRIWSLEQCQLSCLLLRLAQFLVVTYLTFATTPMSHPLSLDEDMPVESPCLVGGKESDL